MSARPFRDLCPEADLRDAMTEEEFWAHVSANLSPSDELLDDDGPELDVAIAPTPCPTCGESGACSYDAEGLPLIHATEEDA